MNLLFDDRGCRKFVGPKRRKIREPHGNGPEFVFDFNPCNGFSRQPLPTWGIDGFVGQDVAVNLSPLSSWANRSLSAIETDWINLALAIYSADRFAARRPGGSAGRSLWRRSIQLRVPVADPSRWEIAKPQLLDALTFLTDDRWRLSFIPRRLKVVEEMQMHLANEPRERPSWICLFSGGLDSLAGLQLLNRGEGSKGLLVSGWTHERLRCGQEAILKSMGGARGRTFEWLPIGYGFPRILDSSGMESSQRSRGWVHVALGLAAAVVSNHDVLDVCENGIGAFNLPTELSQTGSHTSRAVHPVFLHRISKAAGIVFGRELKIRQSALFETKGELLKRAFERGESNLAELSFSCEIFPNYNSRQPQCGVCPSCLVRRAALHAAGMADPGTGYSFDVYSSGIPPRRSLGLIKMQRYVRRIDCCFGPASPLDAVLWEYPEAGSYFDEAARSLDLSLDDFLTRLRRLHQSFALEWKEFANSLPTQQQAAHLTA